MVVLIVFFPHVYMIVLFPFCGYLLCYFCGDWLKSSPEFWCVFSDVFFVICFVVSFYEYSTCFFVLMFYNVLRVFGVFV